MSVKTNGIVKTAPMMPRIQMTVMATGRTTGSGGGASDVVEVGGESFMVGDVV